MKRLAILFLSYISLSGYDANNIDYVNNDHIIKYENDFQLATYNKPDKKFYAYEKKIKSKPSDDIYVNVTCEYRPLSNAEEVFNRLVDEYEMQMQERGLGRIPVEIENNEIEIIEE